MKSNANSGIGRREFLQLSAAAAAGAVLLGPEMLASEAVTPTKRLAVGYVQCLEAMSEDAFDVISARDIFTTDASFLRHGARIAVAGSAGADMDPGTRRAVELNANYSYLDGATPLTAPFFAWTLDRRTGRTGQSSFVVPVNDQQAINLTVGMDVRKTAPRRRAAGNGPVVPVAGTERIAAPLTLSLKGDPGSYPLVRGYYVIVPLIDGEREPDWSSYLLRHSFGMWGLYEHGRHLTAPIEHLVLRLTFAV